MKMYIYIPLLLLALLVCVLSSPVNADSVHKWVDEKGVTHYSDQAPQSDAYNTKQIDVSNAYASSDYQDDYYSVTNQWARMREERLERKKLQLEKVKQKAALKQAQAAAVPQVVYVDQEDDRYSRYYFPSYPYRYAAKKYRKSFSKGFHKGYRASSCRLPRNRNSRYGRSGLTLSIR